MEENESAEITAIDHRPVELHFCKGKILVWNADDVRLLRETHHIVGALVGSLPRSPRQNAQLGLPLQLLAEEAAVLLEYGVAKMVNVKIAKPSAKGISEFEQARKKSFREQQALWDALNLKKKQDFEHVIAIGRTTKKHRRSERAKKKKKEMATSGDYRETCSPNSGEMVDEDGGDNRTPEDTVTEATGLHGLEENNSVPDRDLSSNISLAMSAESRQKENISKGVASNASSCMETSKTSPADFVMTSYPHADVHSRTEKTCFRTHPAQGDIMESQPLCESDSTLNGSGALDSVESNSKVEQMPQSPKSGTSSSNLFTENENKNGDGEEISDMTLETSQTTEAKFCPKQSNVPPSTQLSTCEDSSLSEQCSNTINDPEVSSNTDPDAMTNERESPLAQDVRSDEVDIFKKPPDPQPCLGYLVHIVTASPSTPRQEVTEWAFPSTQQEILKYRIFKDLWETGYYLTSGCKFGGDFLVYPGDPFLYHSYFIAICVPHEKALSPLELITYGRLGTTVKKTVIICSVDEGDNVVYTSLQWTGFS